MILYYFHSLDCTKCKFPDFTQYYFFPWLSTHVPDFCQVWNFPGLSLTTGHPVNSLTWNICGRFIPVCNAIFIRPFEKRDVLCRGNVRPSVCPSVCPSVRPSVRPRFPDFSSTCFEISIWNLVYTFSRWHDMSSLSCITIGSLWPSLQPKVGQTYFLQSWPHK